MSLFKIKVTPLIKDREIEVKYVQSGRIFKKCAVCGTDINKGKPSTTFIKRNSIGDKTTYDSRHTCGDKNSACTIALAHKLDVVLP